MKKVISKFTVVLVALFLVTTSVIANNLSTSYFIDNPEIMFRTRLTEYWLVWDANDAQKLRILASTERDQPPSACTDHGNSFVWISGIKYCKSSTVKQFGFGTQFFKLHTQYTMFQDENGVLWGPYVLPTVRLPYVPKGSTTQ